MRTTHALSTLVLACALAACGTAPKNPILEEARSGYSAAQSDPNVSRLAPLQLQDAGKALDNANRAQEKGEDKEVVNHLAYVAKQRVQIAQETAHQKNAEAEIAEANAERDKIRLETRTAEAEAAKQQAAQSAEELAAANAAREQDRQRMQAQQAETEEARRQAEQAQQANTQTAAQLEEAQAKLKQMESELNELNAKKTERGMVITLGDVLFDTNKAQLKPGAQRSLEKLAAFFKEYPERKAEIEGFTDSTGGDEYNQKLSERRAESVKQALVDMGVEADRISTRGYGKQYPVATNATPAGRQLNRRVEIVLSDEQGNVKSR